MLKSEFRGKSVVSPLMTKPLATSPVALLFNVIVRAEPFVPDAPFIPDEPDVPDTPDVISGHIV